jgi:hypothetical protein
MKIKKSILKIIERVARKDCFDKEWKRNLGKMLKVDMDGWDWAFNTEFQSKKDINNTYVIPASYRRVMKEIILKGVK